jgi:23S rRNA (cytidine1920-2'-O)/16S rRNA (cytidine1409-2'-O)-methyltransferase
MTKILKTRLDILLVERRLTSSREKARALIMEGKVLVDGVIIDKPGKEILNTAELGLKEPLKYVSRGGLKLSAAIDKFDIDPAGLTVLDAGASTGGFTDCLLQRGAKRIVAVDVGYGQFDWKLRNNPRVRLLERTNFRYLDISALNESVDAAVADLSFISLRLVLFKFAEILSKGNWFVPLVKPQFEVGRKDVGKHGVVRNPDAVTAALHTVKRAATDTGFMVVNELESPILGPKGNHEFLIHLVRV